MLSRALSALRGNEESKQAASWEARPVAARVIRLTVTLLPIGLGAGAAIVANDLLPIATTTFEALFRSFEIIVASTLMVWGVDRYARKLLPLAALMQLSLVFPDKAPSRFRSALKSGSSRRLERTLDETRRFGLAKDPGDAARQVVQLIGAIGDHDRRTRGHSERVRLYADLVGQELKLSKEERQKLQWGALLHDLGKLMVPSEILNKNGKPDAEEWRILQGHPDEGMRLIEPLRGFLGEWVHAIGGHHEKWDGSGYPRGLSGYQIPRAAAIVAVADSFEVMTAVRSYKKAMPLADARAELTRCAGSHFSPDVVRAFLNISLGHLRIVSGPIAALAHVPFIGNVAQMPSAIAPALASASAMPTAALVTAVALTVAAPVPAAQSTADAATQQAVAAAAPAPGPSAATGASGRATATTTTTAAATDSAVAGTGAVAAEASTTTAAAPATTAPVPTTTTAAKKTTTTTTAAAPATTAPVTTTTAKKTTTTTAAAAPAQAAPATVATTAAPTTTAKPATTTTTIVPMASITVSTSSYRMPAKALDGNSFAAGTSVYIYSGSWLDKVEWTYPGGSRTSSGFPFDMIGSSGIQATAWQVPSTPGTYTVTARGKRNDTWGPTVTATFTVT